MTPGITVDLLAFDGNKSQLPLAFQLMVMVVPASGPIPVVWRGKKGMKGMDASYSGLALYLVLLLCSLTTYNSWKGIWKFTSPVSDSPGTTNTDVPSIDSLFVARWTFQKGPELYFSFSMLFCPTCGPPSGSEVYLLPLKPGWVLWHPRWV